jgi:hypothetical protein
MLPSLAAGPGHLADNVMHFARVLRSAGMAVGTDRIQLALQALPLAGLERREDFYAVLHACLLDRHEHQELFDQAFALFWRDPDLMGRMQALLLPKVQSQVPQPVRESRRLADALFPPRDPASSPPPPPPEEIELQAEMSWSEREQLRSADFESMSAEEFRAAQRALARLAVSFERLPSRRFRAATQPGRIDWRATLRDMARHGGEFAHLAWRAKREVVPPLVVLADISGSMARYSRMLLHFAHLLVRSPPRVESFVFGTRLTRITRWLKQRDPDIAVAQVTAAVQDWSGGTRIAQCLREFNRRWARRVMPSDTTVLLVSDGLEHGHSEELAFEMERLHKGCRRLLWLNPLLRFEKFEPRAAGIRAMRPHVDAFLPVHNLQSLDQLVKVLAAPGAANSTGAAERDTASGSSAAPFTRTSSRPAVR